MDVCGQPDATGRPIHDEVLSVQAVIDLYLIVQKVLKIDSYCQKLRHDS